MFCPLCRSEFREGFTEYSDCEVALVETFAEASSRSARLWKGDRQSELDRILATLDGAKIPCHYKEIVNANLQMNILGIPIGPQKPTFEYEVWVFRDDLERARLSGRVV